MQLLPHYKSLYLLPTETHYIVFDSLCPNCLYSQNIAGCAKTLQVIVMGVENNRSRPQLISVCCWSERLGSVASGVDGNNRVRDVAQRSVQTVFPNKNTFHEGECLFGQRNHCRNKVFFIWAPPQACFSVFTAHVTSAAHWSLLSLCSFLS